ncbi:MAG: MarR family transcriptional regulator [Planctomycetes bacterium]|nr:MarR family transcriptional regulator [Planctomycetota bacterium]
MAAVDETYISRGRSIASVITVAQKIFRAVTDLVRRHDLTESQYNALRVLRGAARRDEKLTQAQLADRLIASRANTTWILDRLEERKLIERQAHSDRRKNTVVITPGGQKLLTKIDPEFEQFLAGMLGDIDADELAGLQALLAKFKFK